MGPRQDAKIAESNIATGEQLVQKRVTAVRELKHHALEPSSALGKYHSWRAGLGHGVHQDGNVLRPVLSVRIHYHHGISLPVFPNVSQCDGNSSLMPAVAPECQDGDALDQLGMRWKFVRAV